VNGQWLIAKGCMFIYFALQSGEIGKNKSVFNAHFCMLKDGETTTLSNKNYFRNLSGFKSIVRRSSGKEKLKCPTQIH